MMFKLNFETPQYVHIVTFEIAVVHEYTSVTSRDVSHRLRLLVRTFFGVISDAELRDFSRDLSLVAVS